MGGCDNKCGSSAVVGCDGVCGSRKVWGCDGVCGSGKVIGCDGVCGSGKVIGGCDKKCGSTAVVGGCDNQCGSTKVVGCDGVCGSRKRLCVGSGDPHYVLMNGAYRTCYDFGWRLLARGCISPSCCWQVHVNQVPWNVNPLTSVIERINVTVTCLNRTDRITLGPGAWGATVLNAGQLNQINVTASSVLVAGMDLRLSITSFLRFFNVFLCSGVVSSGICVNGCDTAARSDYVAPMQPLCEKRRAFLPPPFLDGCNFDVELVQKLRPDAAPVFVRAAEEAAGRCNLGACGCRDNVTCRDCLGVPHGQAKVLACGCNDDTSCRDCDGKPYGRNWLCRDCRGVLHGTDWSCCPKSPLDAVLKLATAPSAETPLVPPPVKGCFNL